MLTVFGKMEGEDWELFTVCNPDDLTDLQHCVDMAAAIFDRVLVQPPYGESFEPLAYRPANATLH